MRSTRTDDLYYDDGAGWEPIGTCDGTYECHASDPGYAATFRGNGHVIRNLLIRRPDASDNVGLFGYLAGGSRIEEVGLRGVHVEGRMNMSAAWQGRLMIEQSSPLAT